MLLINEKEETLTSYDCRLINRQRAINTMIRLIRELKIKEYELSKKVIDENDSLTAPVYFYESLDSKNKNLKVSEIKSTTPYTIAFLGLYIQNNWLEEIYSYIKSSNEQIEYLKTQIKRMKGYSQKLYPLLENPLLESRENTKKILESLQKQPEIFSIFLKDYLPDAYAFKQLFPDIELSQIYSHSIHSKKLWTDFLDIGYANNDTLRLLKLTPNIRK